MGVVGGRRRPGVVVNGIVAALVAGLVAGCTGSAAAPPGVASPTVSSASGPLPTGTWPQGGRRPLEVTRTVRIPLPGQTFARQLVVWDGFAAWLGCAGCEGTSAPLTLYVADLQRRRVRAVTTAPAGGMLVPLGGQGSLLAYGTGVRVGRGSTRWTLTVHDLTSGARRTPASTVQAADDYPPVAVVGAGRVAWQVPRRTAPGAAGGPVTVAELRTGRPRPLVTDLPGRIAALTTAGLVYAGPTSAARLEAQTLDVLVLPQGPPRPRVLSDTHDVAQLTGGEDGVIWQTAQGEDSGVWARTFAREDVGRRYHRGNTWDRAIGRGFVAVVTAGDDSVVLVYPLRGGPAAAAPDVPVQAESLAAAGDRLVYLALPGERGRPADADHPVQLVVATVTGA